MPTPIGGGSPGGGLQPIPVDSGEGVSGRGFNQIVGEVMVTAAAAVYTPSFRRMGESAIFTAEALQVKGTFPVVTVDIEHKDLDSTTWATAGSFTSFTITGQLRTKALTNLKEDIRLKFTMATGEFARMYLYEVGWRK